MTLYEIEFFCKQKMVFLACKSWITYWKSENTRGIPILNQLPQQLFMPPAWKVRRGHLVVGSSIRLSVHLSVCLSIRPSFSNSVPLANKVQYLKFGWWYSNQTWTVSSSKGCSHFTDITCPWGIGRGQNLGLRDFAIFWLGCRRGHPCFTNTCLVSF